MPTKKKVTPKQRRARAGAMGIANALGFGGTARKVRAANLKKRKKAGLTR